MNVCVKTGALVADNMGRMFPCDLFLVAGAIVVRASVPLKDNFYEKEEVRRAATHRVELDHQGWDRLRDVGVAVVPRDHLTGEIFDVS